MESIAIFSVPDTNGSRTFHAVARAAQAEGRTPGEALDGLGLGPSEVGTVVLIQPFRRDDLFDDDVRARLEHLMSRWRSARDAGQQLPASEQSELQSLIDAELLAATVRSKQMIQRSGG
jgi:hypothetical protein